MPKQRKCIHCKAYKPELNGLRTPVGYFCTYEHAQAYALNKTARKRAKEARDKAKQERAERRARKEALRDRKWWLRKAEQTVNRYVNTRDHGKPCFSCDRPYGTHKRNASHYRSVGACKALRYNVFNIHSSCVQCNQDKSGNAIEYRIRLVRKYGEQKVKWLESQNGTPKYTIEYLKRLVDVYTRKTKVERHRTG